VVLALTASTISVFGQLTLTNIPTLGGDASNEGRCITPDGKYVGGLSGTVKGFFYDVSNDYVVQPVKGSGAGKAVTGIAYRMDTNQSPAQMQIIVDTECVGWKAFFMTSDAGTNWLRYLTALDYSLYASPVENSLAGTTNSDVFPSTFRNTGKTAVYTARGSNLWNSGTAPQFNTIGKSSSGTDKVYVNGVAATGRIVGYRFDGASATNRNNLWDWPPSSGTSFQWKGLDGTVAGEAWSVSQNGTIIFGRSPITPGGTNLYAYKTVITTPPASQTSIYPLPELPNLGGSITRAVPYGCTADGNYAVGMNYPGTTVAVLWDTTSADPTKWRASDLTALATANGAADIFTRLVKAYSVGTNGSGDPVITGYGIDANITTRAFLMTVPKWVAAIQFPGNRSAGYGTTVVFQALTNGTDLLTYQWYKNGTPLADGGNVSGATSATLSLTGVSCPGGEAGSYQVVVSNAPISGVVTSGVAVLTVNDPFISVQPASHVCILGSNTTFTVVAAGTPTLTYQWKQNGGILNDGPTGYGSTISGATTDILRIENVTVSDQANYSVDVISSAGCGPAPAVTSAEATLTAMARPILYPYLTSSGGDYTLNFEGPGGQPYKVLYSTNAALSLSRWIPLATGSFSGGPESYTDIAPTNSPRFYILSSP
jgi:hypothetical protein